MMSETNIRAGAIMIFINHLCIWEFCVITYILLLWNTKIHWHYGLIWTVFQPISNLIMLPLTSLQPILKSPFHLHPGLLSGSSAWHFQTKIQLT